MIKSYSLTLKIFGESVWLKIMTSFTIRPWLALASIRTGSPQNLAQRALRKIGKEINISLKNLQIYFAVMNFSLRKNNIRSNRINDFFEN